MSTDLAGLESRLKLALRLDLPYAERTDPIVPITKSAAVLILFAEAKDGEPALLVTRRTETVETHKGQMAFPGGMFEERDSNGENDPAVAAALRETEEEVGIAPETVRVLGALPPLWTVTGFMVTPIVGVSSAKVSEIALRPSPGEIAAAYWIPFSALSAPSSYQMEQREYKGARYPIHVYSVEGQRIWGATGSMIKNLLDRLRSLS